MFTYISTRGAAPELGFSAAVRAGLAADGGLYVPRVFPRLTAADVSALAEESYVDAARRVMAPFLAGDALAEDMFEILAEAYDGFFPPEVAPLTPLGDNLFLLELFHGPTFAFKDIALRFLAQVFGRIQAGSDGRMLLLAATSGDTGSAALSAFAGSTAAALAVLHPAGRVSEVQRRQMTTICAPNILNIAVEGTFDDCQAIVKTLLSDRAWAGDWPVSAVNSINWARILAQVVYYARASAQLFAVTGKPTSFVVPTGNFGNIYAAHVARRMGAPIARLAAATNRNDILHRFFTSGTMRAEGVTPSLSPSMDIQVSSNFERLLFEALADDAAEVQARMRDFAAHGAFSVDVATLRALSAQFFSARASDEDTLEAMNRVFRATGVFLDPHTATAVKATTDLRAFLPEGPMAALATAHPAKFPAAVMRATGVEPPAPPALAAVMRAPEHCLTLPPTPGAVADAVRSAFFGLEKDP